MARRAAGGVRLVTGDTDVLCVRRRLAFRPLDAARQHRDEEGLRERSSHRGVALAEHLLEAAAADIDVFRRPLPGEGHQCVDRVVRGGGRRASTRTAFPSICAARWRPTCDEHVKDAAFPYGCHVCEVEVDPDTGVVEIVRYAAVDDVGRAVNPMIVHGQTHGSIAQGLGQALLEHCHYDPGSGQLFTSSFMDYAMPRADGLPSFTTEISEVPATTHPLGIRPGGEGGTAPALAVVDQRHRRRLEGLRRAASGNAGDAATGLASDPW